jgi:hypothetical protein
MQGQNEVSNVPHILEETSKTHEMKTTTENLYKNSVCFKIRKGNTCCSLIKQKVPETYFWADSNLNRL